MWKKYDSHNYPKFDNYDAINIDNVNKIGFYNRSDYHVNSEVKDYYQKAIYYLKQEYMIYFDKSNAFKAAENQLGARYMRVHN